MMNNNGIGKIIQPIFLPAIALLNRMGYTKKFTLLWLMSVAAIAVVMYGLFVSLERVIQPSKLELQGLTLMEPISHAVQAIQLHRGLSATLLSGNEAVRNKHAASKNEAAMAFAAMEERLPPGLRATRNWQSIKTSWERLLKEGLDMTANDNLAAHIRLVEKLLFFEVMVADKYALTMDPQIETYYLIDTAINTLPFALDHIGQLRAHGASILTSKRVPEAQKTNIYKIIGMLEDALAAAEVNLEKAGRYDPVLQESLSATSRIITDSARQVIGIMESDILTGRSTLSPDDFFAASTSAVDKSYQQIYESLLPATKALLKVRIAKAEKLLLVSIGSSLLLLLLVVYISISIYYAIIGNVRSLVHAAHTFAEGDLNQRVKLRTRDELSQVADSFNRMAEGFNAMLEARKQAEQSLHESEMLYRSLFENMLNGFAYCQMIFEQGQPQDCIYLSVNAAFEVQTGLKNVVGKRASEVIPGIWQFNPELLEIYGRVSLSGKPEQFEIYLKAMQQWFWISVYSPAKGYFVAVFDVITERKRAEEALRKSKDLLQSVVENAPVHIFWKDRDSRYQGCNTQFAKAAGHSSPDEVIGKTDFDMWRKDLAELYRADDKAVIDSGTPKLDYEEPGTTPDGGNMIWARTSKVPLRGESNQIIGILGIYEDITERKQAERALMESRQRAQLYLDTAGVILIALDAQGMVQMINRKGCEMLGYSEADILGKNWFDNYLSEPAREETRKIFTQLMGGNHASAEYHENEILTSSGDVLMVAWHNASLLDESGKINGVLSSGEDITVRMQAEQSLIISKDRLNAVIETALDAVVQMDAAGIITGWNAQAEKIFGWSREEAVGRMMSETIIPPQYREAHKQGLKRFLATGKGAILNSRIELSALHRDGHEFPVELAVVSIKIADKHEFSAFIHDITSRKESENMIWKQANFDMLTGLPNRHMFYDRLAQEIKKAGRSSLTMALLYIDLDHFKEINDTLGHSMGDKLLLETARRISACVRETDTVARLGGDEFIIILTELNEVKRIDALAQNILHELVEPFRLENEVIYLSASIGITLYPHDATGMEELVKSADQAMYAAKNAGRNRFSYFTQSMQQTAQTKLRLTSDLRSALAASQFRVYYQPIVELATGRIHKAEALVRWQHPVRGLVSPAEFIPLAEETGLILEIGDWVFREAARQAKRWGALCGHEFQISVNMSPIQFHNADNSCQTWPVYLRELGLPGQCMVIEITEGLLLNEEVGVKDKLLRFHGYGIQISLDDFGTGYSSLSYLQKFDIDFLKIDQSFTRGMEPGSKNMALSEAIIVMAHKLDMKVIAEGVETEAQRTLLAAAGCDYAQGYLFSRPVPAEELEELLKSGLTNGYQAR